MSNNNVKDWGEFQKLAELHQLENLLFVGMLLIYACVKLTSTMSCMHVYNKILLAEHATIARARGMCTKQYLLAYSYG